MTSRILIIFIACFCLSCSIKSEKKYVVVDSFSTVVLETDDKEHAFHQAQQLTLLGRVFASKPDFFVIEIKK